MMTVLLVRGRTSHNQLRRLSSTRTSQLDKTFDQQIAPFLLVQPPQEKQKRLALKLRKRLVKTVPRLVRIGRGGGAVVDDNFAAAIPPEGLTSEPAFFFRSKEHRS